ncbi:PAS domain-containing protein [Methylobacterium platani]|uniref:PAS domain-containing protein n=1 Tax=Methylobacterium platani TaxID=427683 RepID=UPI001FD8267D|nr:PAS domain-containing protein [Methylobacterium platani]
MAPSFVLGALAASQVSTWETDVARGVTATDAATAALFGLDARAAGRGLPLAQFVDAIHPDDREMVRDRLAGMSEQGGLFVVEYRTCPRPGTTRWILARGRYERDPLTGDMMGRGIVIDITDSKRDGHAEDRAFFLIEEDPIDGSLLDRAAAQAIATREAIDRLDPGDRSELRQVVDLLLVSFGRALARRLG